MGHNEALSLMLKNFDGEKIIIADLNFSFKFKKIPEDDYSELIYTGIHRLEKPYDSAIGEVLTRFATIESMIRHLYLPLLLDNQLIFSKYNNALGSIVSSKLSSQQVFELYVEYAFRVLSKIHTTSEDELRIMRKKVMISLRNSCTVRNLVAHANWSERTLGCYFLTEVKYSEKTGENEYKFAQMSVKDLKRANKYLDKVYWQTEKLGNCIQEYMDILISDSGVLRER